MKQPVMHKARREHEPVIDDGSGDLVVEVGCQEERHYVRLSPDGRLSFDHHDDVAALAYAGEAAALAKQPQLIRCAEILIVWRYWNDMAKKFPDASRTFGLPQALLGPRSHAQRLRDDRRKFRESEERRMHRERTAFKNRVFKRLREKRGELVASDQYGWVNGEWKRRWPSQ